MGATTDLSDAVALVGNEASVTLSSVPVVWAEYVKEASAKAYSGALVLYKDS